MAKATDISKDVVLRFRDDLFAVVEFQHISPGKGSAFTRTKLKSLRTGKVLEQTFKDSDEVDIVDVERRKMQYLYTDASGATFMDNENYGQVTMSQKALGDKAAYLQEGREVVVLTHEGEPVTVDIPRKVTLKVVETVPGVRGDTATNVTKEAKTENGLTIRVPLFIKEGELVIVNTETGAYVERA